MKLLFATTNEGKVAELRALVKDLDIEVVSLSEMPRQPRVLEDGLTFEANAIKKARAYGAGLKMAALADDSGLCVDALNGAPGVFSARYAMNMGSTSPGSPRALDRSNNQKLLQELRDVPPEKRGAEFRCALALVLSPEAEPVVVHGVCRGRIAAAPRGQEGFGYDPLFEVEGLPKTFAELTREEKNRLSHRAKAFAALRPELQKLAGK